MMLKFYLILLITIFTVLIILIIQYVKLKREKTRLYMTIKIQDKVIFELSKKMRYVSIPCEDIEKSTTP